jgi:hypothetical protein
MYFVKHLNIFLNNYKFSTSRQYKSFYVQYNPTLLSILSIFKQLGYVYSFNINLAKTHFKVYPRYNHRFVNFHASLKRPFTYLSLKQINKLRIIGYNFILYTPFVKTRNKFISSFDIYSNRVAGYLIIKWLNSIQRYCQILLSHLLLKSFIL